MAESAGPESSARASDDVALRPGEIGRCRRRVHLDHDPAADRDARRPLAPGLQLRHDILATHRREIGDAVAQVLPVDETWRVGESARPTAIWRTTLRTPSRIATPDLLLRAADGGYLPILVRGHRSTDPGTGARLTPLAELTVDVSLPVASSTKKLRSHHADRLALAHLYRMLQELGLASRQRCGGIIGRGGPAADADWDDGAVVAWHDLDPVLTGYDAAFADQLAVARAAASGRPALATPSKVSECRRCPWWTVCGPELAAAHDISLLVSGQDVTELRRRGIKRYDVIATMTSAEVSALTVSTVPIDELQTRAQAMVAGVPLVRRTAAVAVTRADVELDVDMESFADDGAYLWGTYLTGRLPEGATAGYRPFVTWSSLDSRDAAANFVAFWRWLSTLRTHCREAGLSFAAYCYSHAAEERWLFGTPARFPDVAGMPTRDEVAAFCRSPEWVDLYLEVKRAFIVPGSMKLKRVAQHVGFAWRDPEPGGENSMAWYRVATNQGMGAPPAGDREANRQRILRYNEDDVIATYRLRQWMSDESQSMPTAAQLNAAAGIAGS